MYFGQLYCLRLRFSILSMPQNLPEGLLEHRPLGLTPGVCDSVGLGWGPRICVSNKFLGDTDAAVTRPHSENH